MKNKLFLASIALVFLTSACKKDLTCECTETSTYSYSDSQGNTYSDVSDPTKTEISYKKVKKSKMKTICGDSEYSSSSTEVDSGVSSTDTYSSKNKCVIK